MSKDPQKTIKDLEKRIAKLESRACIHEGVFVEIAQHLRVLRQAIPVDNHLIAQ